MSARLLTEQLCRSGSELLIGICLLLPGVGTAAQSRQVLLLYDERTDLAGLAMLDAGIVHTLERSPDRIEIFREAMDLSRFDSPEYRNQLRDFLRGKYAAKKIDVAVAIMQPALDFLLESPNAISPSVPIVFCGIDRSIAAKHEFPARVTGVLLKREFGPTVELALRLHPTTERFAVISGTSDFDRRLLQQAKAEFAAFANRVSFTYYTDPPLSELLTELSRLPPRTVVLYTTMFRDGAGTAVVPHEVVERVSAAANSPLYGFLDQYVGRGIVGGRLYSLEAHGEAAAGLALQVLSGKSPTELPLLEPASSVTQFDWRQLERWRINESQLAPDSVIRFRPRSYWREDRAMVLTVAAVFMLQTWVIGALVIQHGRRKRAERELRENEKRMTLAADAARLGMLVWNAEEDRMWASEKWKEIHGYKAEEEVCFEGFLQRVHPDDRETVQRTVNMALRERSLFTVQHRVIPTNGQVRWISKRGRVEPVANGLRLLSVAIDITDRVEAEEAAREVSGRLISAQEDERKRIARDLHDDLNQRLAMLSVEADLLGQMDHNAGAQPLIESIAKQVRDLSTEIHKLSYQLHPVKLEQLGLVSATRALCNEQTKLWKVGIEFVQTGVPRELNRTAALCLYRIMQESLQNIGRHSQATAARVELRREGAEIKLEVSDNGRGFDIAAAAHHAGLGLVAMRERARLVRGHVSFDSAPGKGTRIQVTVPLGPGTQPST